MENRDLALSLSEKYSQEKKKSVEETKKIIYNLK